MVDLFWLLTYLWLGGLQLSFWAKKKHNSNLVKTDNKTRKNIHFLLRLHVSEDGFGLTHNLQ